MLNLFLKKVFPTFNVLSLVKEMILAPKTNGRSGALSSLNYYSEITEPVGERARIETRAL